MLRSKLAALALVATLFATGLNAQTFLSEDWSTGSGTVPPAGWSSMVTGSQPAPWRFDNPGARPFDTNFVGNFAISDPDQNGSGSNFSSTLRSPVFNASGTTLLNLSFDQQLRDLSSGWSIDVFDGSMWNTVAAQANNTSDIDIGYLMPNADTTVNTMYDITTAAGGAANAQLRFVYEYGYDWWWAIDNVKIEQPSAVDLALLSIDSPVDNPSSCLPITGLQTVTVTIENQGALLVPTGTLLQIDYTVNGGPAQVEFILLAADLNPNTTMQYTFGTQANFPAPGPNTLTATVVLAGDGDPTDDSFSQVYSGAGGLGLVSLPYSENFDGAAAQNSTILPAGWIQDTADGTGGNEDWYLHYGQTSSINTGPHADHTTGGTGIGAYYAYVEDSTPNQAQVNMLTPCFDLTTAVSPIAQFWMCSFNGLPATYSDNNLSVDVISYPGGAVSMDVFGPQGSLPGQAATWAANAPTEWQQQTVNLSAFAGQVVQLRFRGQSDQTPQYNDIAIDDFSIIEPMPTPGQAARAGLGAFDINGAINVNGIPVSGGLGGPYFANVTQGGSFNMSFDGNASQPITVVYGALNPVSASYPGGIGQFDIGGPGVDGMGIPLNIAVFVNAIGWAQAGFPGFPIDAMFFTGATGQVSINFTFPNFGIPMGATLTTFQSAIAASAAPFVYITNAIQVTVN